jgi:hypothetical protein
MWICLSLSADIHHNWYSRVVMTSGVLSKSVQTPDFWIRKDGFVLRFVPWHLAVHLFDRTVHTAQFVANLDHAETDHSWIETQEPSDILLRLHGSVELHYEVVALTVLCLMFRGRPREVELSPVLHAADNAVRGEYLLASDASDPAQID